jgi:hypothetical protein
MNSMSTYLYLQFDDCDLLRVNDGQVKAIVQKETYTIYKKEYITVMIAWRVEKI